MYSQQEYYGGWKILDISMVYGALELNPAWQSLNPYYLMFLVMENFHLIQIQINGVFLFVVFFFFPFQEDNNKGGKVEEHWNSIYKLPVIGTDT